MINVAFTYKTSQQFRASFSINGMLTRLCDLNAGKEGMFSGRSYQDGHIIVADGTLTIYSVHTQDQGTYTCEALNPVGSNSAQVQLTVLRK